MRRGQEIVHEVRRLSREREFSVGRFLARLDQGWYADVELCELPAAERVLLVAALRAMLPERTGNIRLNVAQALFELGDPLGWQTFRECLGGDDAELCRGALERLTKLPYDPKTRGYKVSIDADAVMVALERPLAAESSRTRQEAVHVLKRLNTPHAFDRVTHLLGDPRADVRTEAAICIGDCGCDRGALAVISEMLQVRGHPKRYFLVRALEHLCESSDANISARAAEVAVHIIGQALAVDSDSGLDANFVANDIWHCMDGIAAAGSPHEQDVLRQVLATNTASWIRGMALKRLAQQEGRVGISRLLQALSDTELRKDALDGLISLGRGSSDPAVLEALAQELARDDAENVCSLVKAYLAFGGDATANLLDKVLTRLDPGTAMTIHWVRRSFTPRAVAAKLMPACGDRALSEETIDKLEEKWLAEFDAISIVYQLLGKWNRITALLHKDTVSPTDHAGKVRDLGKISADQFSIDEVVQTMEPDGNLRVLLVHRDQGFSFAVENRGRWRNVKALLDGLNCILQSLGLAERFIQLVGGGDEAAVLAFVHADKFLTAARDLGLPAVERASLASGGGVPTIAAY